MIARLRGLPPTPAVERSLSLTWRGRYLASVTCSECHGLDFGGNTLERAPTLAIVGAYTAEQRSHLIRTARGIGDA